MEFDHLDLILAGPPPQGLEAVRLVEMMGALVSDGIVRAWGISGAYVQKPQVYALGSMIRDADSGAIRITARRPVFLSTVPGCAHGPGS